MENQTMNVNGHELSVYTSILNQLCDGKLKERLLVAMYGVRFCPIIAPPELRQGSFLESFRKDLFQLNINYQGVLLEASRTLEFSSIRQICNAVGEHGNFGLSSEIESQKRIAEKLKTNHTGVVLIGRGHKWTSKDWDDIGDLCEYFEKIKLTCAIVVFLYGDNANILNKLTPIKNRHVEPIVFSFDNKEKNHDWPLKELIEAECGELIHEIGFADKYAIKLKDCFGSNLGHALQAIQIFKAAYPHLSFERVIEQFPADIKEKQ